MIKSVKLFDKRAYSITHTGYGSSMTEQHFVFLLLMNLMQLYKCKYFTWLRYVLRMHGNRFPGQTLHWKPGGTEEAGGQR